MICVNIHSERIIVSGNLFAKRCVVLHVRHCDEFSSIWKIDAYALANVRIRFLMADRLRRVKMSFPSKHNNTILSCIVWMIGLVANSKNELNSIHPFRFVSFVQSRRMQKLHANCMIWAFDLNDIVTGNNSTNWRMWKPLQPFSPSLQTDAALCLCDCVCVACRLKSINPCNC